MTLTLSAEAMFDAGGAAGPRRGSGYTGKGLLACLREERPALADKQN